MKNLLRSIVIILCAGILFSSCSKMGSLSITKRHYSGGYYVDFGGSKPQAPVHKKRVTETPVTTSEVVSSVKDSKEVTPADRVSYSAPVTQVNNAQSGRHTRKQPKPILYASAQDKNTTVTEIQSAALKSYESSMPDASDAPADSASVPPWLMIVFCIILPPLAVGLKFGIVDKFWISLLLTLIFWIPGVVYALILILD